MWAVDSRLSNYENVRRLKNSSSAAEYSQIVRKIVKLYCPSRGPKTRPKKYVWSELEQIFLRLCGTQMRI